MIILCILCAVLICFMIEYAVLCNSLKKAPYNNGQKKDVIIVLGYPAKKDGSVSPILRERINKAAKLYHEGIAEVIICTGAAVANNYIEADVIAQTLIELGVPNCSIIREKLAKGTYENLVNSKKIMKDRGLRTAVIVSSPWHLRKASSYAFRLEINHTVEKSKFPHEYLIIGVGIIYLYLYNQMFIKLCVIIKTNNRVKS
ncbi:YdcF family protein [Clostridium estertheticum]|uniref:YdcF family protein n=1 Tax=Clostridium estertheticum TaxID=238834 RepID=UPI001C0CCCE9|nr:YdcF family protein [Clostridium estertheticum]MBU3216052.1 YdcF family protein [Clostridium estertheticum]WAG55960.1 YdcF family protein [Clostridium estertheticum]